MKNLGSIVAVGMRSALGLGAVETSFLLRTGVPVFAAAPLADPEGEPVTMAFDRTLDPYLVGEERAARLGALALGEIVGRIGSAAARALRAHVVLSFPEPLAGKRDAGVLLAHAMRDVLRETFGSPEVELVSRGAAGLAYALPSALAALARGEIDAIVAGGVHSDYDPAIIASLAAERRLFSPAAPDALVPGEGAAFVLVTRDDLAPRLGLKPLARIFAVASETNGAPADAAGRGFESTAIASVIREATGDLPDEIQVGWAVTDTTFEHARVRELYSALTRTHRRFGPPLVVDSPAQRLGHLGAAAFGLELSFMAVSLARGFAPCPFGLALAASDGGERGAVLVGSP